MVDNPTGTPTSSGPAPGVEDVEPTGDDGHREALGHSVGKVRAGGVGPDTVGSDFDGAQSGSRAQQVGGPNTKTAAPARAPLRIVVRIRLTRTQFTLPDGNVRGRGQPAPIFRAGLCGPVKLCSTRLHGLNCRWSSQDVVGRVRVQLERLAVGQPQYRDRREQARAEVQRSTGGERDRRIGHS